MIIRCQSQVERGSSFRPIIFFFILFPFFPPVYVTLKLSAKIPTDLSYFGLLKGDISGSEGGFIAFNSGIFNYDLGQAA